jgi:hypothetical protein
MDGFLAAGGELMQAFRQQIASLDIDPNAIESQAGSFVHSHLLDELCLPSHVSPEEVVQAGRVIQQFVSREFLCEPAVVLRPQPSELESHRDGQSQKDKDLSLHCK